MLTFCCCSSIFKYYKLLGWTCEIAMPKVNSKTVLRLLENMHVNVSRLTLGSSSISPTLKDPSIVQKKKGFSLRRKHVKKRRSKLVQNLFRREIRGGKLLWDVTWEFGKAKRHEDTLHSQS